MALAILYVPIHLKFLTMLIMLEPRPCGTTEKTDAAVLSLNERSYSPSLRGVLCAADVFVVPWASDKASCSS